MRTYLAFFIISFKQSIAHRWSIFGRFLFYGLILYVFSQLWGILDQKEDLAFSARDLVWYLALTEWIILSIPFVSREIEEDVKSGNLAYLLGRPVSYFWSKYASAMGMHFTRMIFLAFAGFFFAFLFSGGLPTYPMGLLIFIPLAILASFLSLIFQCVVGVTAFWTQDSFPVYLIWQKLVFVLGGMMIPLDLYPDWIRRIAEFTPFPILLYEPAKMAIGGNISGMGILLFKFFLWFLLAIILAEIVFRRACKGLNVNGG